jgi:RNA polymerase sigma-70 factor (ECF subfamily)
LVESVWVSPYPDREVVSADPWVAPEARYEQRESIELAFIAALQQLPPRQRATLILRDVLGFSAREVAAALDTTTASVNSALQRAHRLVDERLPEQSQQAALRALGDDALSEIVNGYVDAWERGDLDAVVAMLANDVTLTMPPMPTWFAGRAAVAGFFGRLPLRAGRRWRLVPVGANGQVAFAHYGWDQPAGCFLPHGVNVLALGGARISEINAFLYPEDFARFGLPDRLAD